MIALQIAVDVLMDLTIVHSRASGDPRASHCMRDQIQRVRPYKIAQET